MSFQEFWATHEKQVEDTFQGVFSKESYMRRIRELMKAAYVAGLEVEGGGDYSGVDNSEEPWPIFERK